MCFCLSPCSPPPPPRMHCFGKAAFLNVCYPCYHGCALQLRRWRRASSFLRPPFGRLRVPLFKPIAVGVGPPMGTPSPRSSTSSCRRGSMGSSGRRSSTRNHCSTRGCSRRSSGGIGGGSGGRGRGSGASAALPAPLHPEEQGLGCVVPRNGVAGTPLPFLSEYPTRPQHRRMCCRGQKQGSADPFGPFWSRKGALRLNRCPMTTLVFGFPGEASHFPEVVADREHVVDCTARRTF